MDITPLAHSGPAIALHAVAAIAALVLGTTVLLMRKGTQVHKIAGRIWVALMLMTAGSSFMITEIEMFGPYSWIHILSLLTFYWVFDGVRKIRKGNLVGHRRAMIGLYSGALVLAGGFTLMPGRRMHAVLFADGGTSALWLAAASLALIAATLAWRRHYRHGSGIGSTARRHRA